MQGFRLGTIVMVSGGNADIDPAVRDRAIAMVDRFTDALEEVADESSAEAKEHLRQATDELMRALAGVMIGLNMQSTP